LSAEVEVFGDNESREHVGEEASSPGRIGEGCCQSPGECIESLMDAGREATGAIERPPFAGKV
jgi:hypothetical protein